MKTLKVLGALLTYPSAELVGALPEFQDILETRKMVTRCVIGIIKPFDGLDE